MPPQDPILRSPNARARRASDHRCRQGARARGCYCLAIHEIHRRRVDLPIELPVGSSWSSSSSLCSRLRIPRDTHLRASRGRCCQRPVPRHWLRHGRARHRGRTRVGWWHCGCRMHVGTSGQPWIPACIVLRHPRQRCGRRPGCEDWR